MKPPELLSPAGSFDALKAAVENGADAVYLGGKEFNARRGAANFDRKELELACKYAHLKGVNVYVTVNILLLDSEIKKAVHFVDFLSSIGVDAVIVQDLGFGYFIKKNFKNIRVHASTQMTVHNLEGAVLLEEINFDRVVLARELSLDEIKEIKDKTKLEVETFVHGALCFCYSGQCLMSSFIGQRSGNRGMCAQPCRLTYTMVDRDGRPLSSTSHILSPKDLNLIEHLPKLIEAGIDSFKIEGRLKRPEYVAQVTSIYRKAIDSYLKNPLDYKIKFEDKKRLAQIFNRGFTTGYYFKNPASALINAEFPRNKGVFLGKVLGYNEKMRTIEILLEDRLRVGDGIDIRGDGGFGYTVTNLYVNKKEVKEARAGTIVEIKTKKAIKKGTHIYKTSDIALLQELKNTYCNPLFEKKIPIDIEVRAKNNTPFEIRVCDCDGNTSIQISDFITKKAISRPLDEKTVRQQIDRLGNTVFKLRNFTAHMDDDIMVPFSVINELRRCAIKDIESQRINKHIKLNPRADWEENLERFYHEKNTVNSGQRLKLSVRVNTPEAVKAAALAGADIIYYGSDAGLLSLFTYEQAYESIKDSYIEFFLVFPRITKRVDMAYIHSILKKIDKSKVSGVLVGNLGVLKEAMRLGFDVVTDFSVNVFNSMTLGVLKKFGVKRAVLSVELNLSQIKRLKKEIETECIIHGRIPLMVSEHDLSSCQKAKKINIFGIKDRIGKIFPIKIDEQNRTHIYNCDELCMINYIDEIKDSNIDVVQLYLVDEKPEKIHYIVSCYMKTINKIEKIDQTRIVNSFTHGHYFRGVL